MKKTCIFFFAYLCIQIVCSLTIGMAWSLVSGNKDVSAMQLITISSVSNIIAIALFTLAKWTPFSREFIQSRPWALLFWSISIGLGVLIPSQFIEELIPASMRTDIIADQLKMIMGNNWGYLAIGLLAPFAEELVFRGAIQRAAIGYFEKRFSISVKDGDNGIVLKENMPHWIGIIFTALLFALIHGNPAQMPHAFLIGLLLGWMCYRSGSIVPGIVVHWVNNTITFCMYAIYPQTYDMKLTDLFGNSQTHVILAIIYSLVIFIPSVYQFHINSKKVRGLK